MGLVQREMEKNGMTTIGISIVRKYTEEVRPPRAVFLKWPMGHPLGEAFKPHQQRTILLHALHAIETMKEPGSILDLPYRWKRFPDRLP